MAGSGNGGRYVRLILGPLPATVVLLPLLLGGGFGALIALLVTLWGAPGSAGARWPAVLETAPLVGWIGAATVGVIVLWVVVLTDARAAPRTAAARGWLVAGLLLGLLAAGRWLWTMAARGERVEPLTWMVWLALLAGPILLGGYYLVVLLRR